MTARDLLEALAPYDPAALPGGGVEHDDALPAGLEAALAVLATGVEALLTGRGWFGCDRATGRSRVLNPRLPVPEGVDLLSVEGGSKWDRVPARARVELPHLFARPQVPAASKSKATATAGGTLL